MVLCKCLLLCFKLALAISPPHLARLQLLIPQRPLHPVPSPLTPPLLAPSRWSPSDSNWPVSIKFWENTWTHRGQVSGDLLQLVICASSAFASLDSWTSAQPHTRNRLPDAPPLQPNLSFHYTAISFPLRPTRFPLSLSSLSIPAATFK